MKTPFVLSLIFSLPLFAQNEVTTEEQAAKIQTTESAAAPMEEFLADLTPPEIDTEFEEVEYEDTVPRHLAWLQGGVASDYKSKIKDVKNKLAEAEKKPPTVEQQGAFLHYLALLDAAGNSKKALKLTKAYVARHPKDSRGVFLLGVSYLKRGKKSTAKYFFQKLEKNKSFPWKSLTLNNLGMMALEKAKRYEAISYFEQAGRAKPAIAAPHANLGALYLKSHSYAQAEKSFYVAQRLDENFEDAVVGRGVALEALGQFKKAHDVYAEFLKGHPNALAVLYNDSILLGKRLNQSALAAQQLLRYVQKGGKETAKAQELIQSWR